MSKKKTSILVVLSYVVVLYFLSHYHAPTRSVHTFSMISIIFTALAIIFVLLQKK